MVEIDARNLHYRDLNLKIRRLVDNGERKIKILNVNGQRYICGGITKEISVEIEGVAGGDLGAFMNGPYIRVSGNSQDGTGNTMNGGKIVVNGMAGDVCGYGMRGGKLYILGDCGYRVGIHMKGYKHLNPVIVIGGSAGEFLCEYMAGGRVIVLGMFGRKKNHLTDDYLATGMHGGSIYLRGEVNQRYIGKGISEVPLNEEDIKFLKETLTDFAGEFKLSVEEILKGEFKKLEPVTHRPYGRLYTLDTPSLHL